MAEPPNNEMTEEEFEAKARAELELTEVKQCLKEANRTFREAAINAVDAFKAHSDHLESRRTEIIERLGRQYPHIADELRQGYLIPDNSRGTHVSRGILFSYKPQCERGSETFIETSLSSHLLDNASNCQEDSSEIRKPLLSKLSPPPLKSASNIRTTESDDTLGKPCSRPRPSRLRPIKTTQGTIKTSVLRNKNYWIFEYRNIHTSGYYILRCPSDDCPNPVFSKNPLCEDRAKRHLQKCGHRIGNVDDLIYHYARTVVTGKKDNGKKREVTSTWVQNHNRNLLSRMEENLKGENLREI
ncbi:hypothetical protein PFICI_03981 [Pestalotiopsis fici W106-1]|uniref:Uncharacterized protein n=1 Tax=Pestalotiopsis fici (strain W106-1 / CGMCC3.15140) TaxID=1229662 RepID=W3XL26_PESFW|nr:uncharacterized protein PFICI_03981 [Pestalotiopsis fici W106-1]ETS85956.1 hypothetical protein PFICI_03981 [Pestalotiopsis fici W106-1]